MEYLIRGLTTMVITGAVALFFFRIVATRVGRSVALWKLIGLALLVGLGTGLASSLTAYALDSPGL